MLSKQREEKYYPSSNQSLVCVFVCLLVLAFWCVGWLVGFVKWADSFHLHQFSAYFVIFDDIRIQCGKGSAAQVGNTSHLPYLW